MSGIPAEIRGTKYERYYNEDGSFKDNMGSVWYLSDLMDYFVNEEGADPAYILNWAIKASEERGWELNYDIDPVAYIENMQNH